MSINLSRRAIIAGGGGAAALTGLGAFLASGGDDNGDDSSDGDEEPDGVFDEVVASGDSDEHEAYLEVSYSGAGDVDELALFEGDTAGIEVESTPISRDEGTTRLETAGRRDALDLGEYVLAAMSDGEPVSEHSVTMEREYEITDIGIYHSDGHRDGAAAFLLTLENRGTLPIEMDELIVTGDTPQNYEDLLGTPSASVVGDGRSRIWPGEVVEVPTPGAALEHPDADDAECGGDAREANLELTMENVGDSHINVTYVFAGEMHEQPPTGVSGRCSEAEVESFDVV